jgi:GDPmannose 4,6-dehydratase
MSDRIAFITGMTGQYGAYLVELLPEVDFFCGDPSKARARLGWSHKVSFDALVREMVDSNLETVRRESVRRNRED